MRGPLPRIAAVALLGGLIASGCMGTGRPDGQDRVHAVVQVTSGAGAPGLATVWIAPEFGEAELLGSVSSGETEQFRYAPTGGVQGQYRLVLQGVGPGPGDQLVSDHFAVSQADVMISWDTSSGDVNVEEIPEPDLP